LQLRLQEPLERRRIHADLTQVFEQRLQLRIELVGRCRHDVDMLWIVREQTWSDRVRASCRSSLRAWRGTGRRGDVADHASLEFAFKRFGHARPNGSGE